MKSVHKNHCSVSNDWATVFISICNESICERCIRPEKNSQHL